MGPFQQGKLHLSSSCSDLHLTQVPVWLAVDSGVPRFRWEDSYGWISMSPLHDGHQHSGVEQRVRNIMEFTTQHIHVLTLLQITEGKHGDKSKSLPTKEFTPYSKLNLQIQNCIKHKGGGMVE
jgi:hypothetical protein